MTTDDRAALAARHRPTYHRTIIGTGIASEIGPCGCGQAWPCDTARALALPPDPEWLAVALHAGGIGPTGVDGHWLCQGVEHHASDAAFIAAWPKP